MRRNTPWMILLLAVLVYAMRGDLLDPLVERPAVRYGTLETHRGEPDGGTMPEAGTARANLSAGTGVPLVDTKTSGGAGAEGSGPDNDDDRRKAGAVRKSASDPATAQIPRPREAAPTRPTGTPKRTARDSGHGAGADSTPHGSPRRGHIRRNSSLYIELTRIGVSAADVTRMARASRRTWNLRRVRPGQAFAVYTGPSGSVDSLELSITREQRLMIRRRGGNRFAAALENTPFTATWHVTSGTIRNSVFASLKKQNAETELAGGLDEIFGWAIDFIRDIRAGDSFTIYYERRHYPDGSTSVGNILAARVVNRGEEHFAVRFIPGKRSPGYYDLEGNSLQKSLRRGPLKLTRVTSNFSGRRFHPVYKTYKPHYGVDYGAPRGTPVYATGDGVIQAATRRRGNGNYIKIRHNNTYTTYYLHLNGFAKGIRSGRSVVQGQLIGYVGSTGAATASHVCYRVKRNGSWVNPRRLKLPSRAPVPADRRDEFNRVRDACMARMQEALARGLKDGTVAVGQPTKRASAQMQSLF